MEHLAGLAVEADGVHLSPASVAVVTHTWLPQTTGLDQPLSWMAVFQLDVLGLGPGGREVGGVGVAVAVRAAELRPVVGGQGDGRGGEDGEQGKAGRHGGWQVRVGGQKGSLSARPPECERFGL